MRTSIALAACLGLVLGLAGTAEARDERIVLDLAQPLPAQKTAIEAAIRSNDYNEISRSDRLAVTEALGRLEALLGEHPSAEHLDLAARTAAGDDRAVINEALGRAWDDSREVCERERPIGSNRPVRICKTVAERRRDRERSELDRGRASELQRRNISSDAMRARAGGN